MTCKDDSFKDNLILLNRSLWYLSFHRQRLYFSCSVEVKLIRSSNRRWTSRVWLDNFFNGLCTVKSHHRITTIFLWGLILNLYINDRFKRPYVTKGPNFCIQFVGTLRLNCLWFEWTYLGSGKLYEERLVHKDKTIPLKLDQKCPMPEFFFLKVTLKHMY